MEQLGVDITEIIERANENGVPREYIEDVLERQLNYVQSERGQDALDGHEEMDY